MRIAAKPVDAKQISAESLASTKVMSGLRGATTRMTISESDERSAPIRTKQMENCAQLSALCPVARRVGVFVADHRTAPRNDFGHQPGWLMRVAAPDFAWAE